MRIILIISLCFCFAGQLSADSNIIIEPGSLSKDQQKEIFRALIDILADDKAKIQQLARGYGVSPKELQEQLKIKSLAEKLQLMLDAFDTAGEAIKTNAKPVTAVATKELNDQEEKKLQKSVNEILAKSKEELVKMAKTYQKTLQEFRDAIYEKEVIELFDLLVDAIEVGQEEGKLVKKQPKPMVLESIPWRIKVDEADELYYKIKPHEVEYHDNLENLNDKYNALSDEAYKAQEPEYHKQKAALVDKLKDKIKRSCEMFAQIDPYLQRRGQSCGEKCKPIEICTEFGW